MATNGRFYGLKRCDARLFRLGKIGKVRKSDEPTGAQGEEIVGLAARAFRAPLYATLPRASRGLCYQSPLLILERLSLALASGLAEAQVMTTQIRDGSGAHQLHVSY